MKEFLKLAIVPFGFAFAGLVWGWLDASSKGLPMNLSTSVLALGYGTVLGWGILALVHVLTLEYASCEPELTNGRIN